MAILNGVGLVLPARRARVRSTDDGLDGPGEAGLNLIVPAASSNPDHGPD